MTTKRKIILGFALVILALVAMAVIGYRGLSGATTSFQYYDRLSVMNVDLSDTMAEVWTQAYYLERFMATRDPKFADSATEHLKKIVELGKNISTFVKAPERQVVVSKLITLSEEYLVLLDDIKKNMLVWQKSYDETIYPAVSELQKITETIGETATRTGNLPVLSELNEAWVRVNRISYRLTRFAEDAAEENAASLSSAIAEMEPIMAAMKALMTSELAKKDFAKYLGTYNTIATTFETQKSFALKALAEVNKSEELDAAILEAVGTLNGDVDTQTEETGVATLAANRAAQTQMLTASIIGVLAGSAFALFIILGLIKVLNRVSGYATAVAEGDFAYDPHIAEGGEIGAMVTALKRIPATLSETIKECHTASNKIACGQFRTRLDEQGFNGGFKELAHAVNSMGESYTKVIDELPVSIMAADTDRRIQFLNTMAQVLAGGNTIGERAEDKLKVVESPSTGKGEVAVATSQGLQYLALSKLPLVDLNGKPAGDMDIITDITQIKQQQITMAEVARKAMDISDRVAAASEELSAQVEQVSRGSEVQRERVESTASAMTEMNSTVLEVARSAGEASEQSDNTRTNAEEGAALVNRVVAAINEVNHIAMRLQENMAGLGKQAESIGGVMNVISDIADQTNLLALNAAIEAARAGEAGRGFAVVADSVRQLAEKTMSATQEVGSSITAIQQSAQTNITEVNSAVQGVTEATDLANSSGEALKGIVGLAGATSAVVASIATAAEEQSATSEEITHAIEEINRIVAETAEGMVQSSHAVQDLSGMAQELKAVLDSLR